MVATKKDRVRKMMEMFKPELALSTDSGLTTTTTLDETIIILRISILTLEGFNKILIIEILLYHAEDTKRTMTATAKSLH